MSKVRVAVVVFAEVESDYKMDATDAAVIVDRVIREAVTGSVMNRLPHTVGYDRPDGQHWDVTLTGLMELGMAAGNGYLWTKATNKMWNERNGATWAGAYTGDEPTPDAKTD